MFDFMSILPFFEAILYPICHDFVMFSEYLAFMIDIAKEFLTMTKRPFKLKWALLALTLILILSGVYAVMTQYKLEVSRYEVTSEKIPQAFKGYKIVHLSDLHGEAYGQDQKELIDLILAQSPDLVVVSGDTLDKHYDQWDNSLKVLKALADVVPVYLTTGNHEYFTRPDGRAEEALKRTGAVYLKNQTAVISKDGASINLSGIDDPWYFEEPGSFESCAKTLYADSSDSFSMLISHRPERQKLYADAGFDLTFSGHAHGGQVRLPFTQGLLAPNQGLFPKLTGGLHETDGKYLLISRGLGNPSKLPRYFNRPEVVVISLNPQ